MCDCTSEGAPLAPSFRGRASARTRNLALTISGFRVRIFDAPRNDGVLASPQIPQHRLDRPALVRRQCGLRRDGIADLVALDRKAGLDAGREVVARERFVEAPQLALQVQRIVP